MVKIQIIKERSSDFRTFTSYEEANGFLLDQTSGIALIIDQTGKDQKQFMLDLKSKQIIG